MDEITLEPLHIKSEAELRSILILESKLLPRELRWVADTYIEKLGEVNVTARVAWVNGKIVGVLVYCINQKVIHIIRCLTEEGNWSVPTFQIFINFLKAKIYNKSFEAILVAIRESDIKSQVIFNKTDFKTFKPYIVKGYFRDTEEDAYLFKFDGK
jgi:hypothetical protein